MQRSHNRFFSVLFGFLAIAAFTGQARTQERGVASTEITTTIVIRGDGSSTYEVKSRQPIVTITATGQKLTMPRCAAGPDSGSPKDWHLRASSRNTGTECIITFTTTHDTLQSLRDRVGASSGPGASGGDINERDGNFTLTITRKDRDISSPLLRYKMTYNYLITVPHLDSFTSGARQGANQVVWTTSSFSHSIELKGHFDKVQSTPLPTPSPSPVPSPSVGQEERPYLGCWSDRDGSALFVSAKTIQTAKSKRALRYKEASSDLPHALFLLRLIDADETKEFKPYVSLEVVGTEMNENDYLSYTDFVRRKSIGHRSWSKDECKNVLPKLRTSGNEHTSGKAGKESKLR